MWYLFASLQNCTYIILNARRLYCLLIHKLKSHLHLCCIHLQLQCSIQFKKSFSLTLLMQNLWSRLQSQLTEACLHQRRVETESLISPDLSLFLRVLDSPKYSVQALMVSVAVYCLLCIVLHTAIFMVALWNRADHYIFILWFLLLLSSSFFA